MKTPLLQMKNVLDRGTCATCAFFHDVKKQCYLNPPQVYYDEHEGSYASALPDVDDDDWCAFWTDARVKGQRKTYNHQINDGDVQFISSTEERTCNRNPDN